MLVRADQRHYSLQDFFFEFKYVSLDTINLSGDQVQDMTQEHVMALPAVQTAFAQAEAAIAKYRPKLLDRYREVTHLHSYALVGIGFDKVVWKKVVR